MEKRETEVYQERKEQLEFVDQEDHQANQVQQGWKVKTALLDCQEKTER